MPSLSVSRLLPADEALRLLATAPFGRLVYSRRALFAVHPVDHVVDDGAIVVHADPAALTIADDPQVVAYEADSIDGGTGAGWHVTVSGLVEEITAPGRRIRYERLWDRAGRLLRIRPELVTGFEYGRAPTEPADGLRGRTGRVRPENTVPDKSLPPDVRNRARPEAGLALDIRVVGDRLG